MFFYLLAFALLAARNNDTLGYILAVAVPAAIFLSARLLPRIFPLDQVLLSLTGFLCALGILILYSVSPEQALRQAIAYGIGMFAMIFCVYLVRSVSSWNKLVPILMLLSAGLLALPLILGREINGALNWAAFGAFSFQPSEIVKLFLIIVLAYFMSRRRFLPWLFYTAACLALLMLQKDLGTALIYYLTALLLYWASSGNLPVTLLGLAGGCATAVAGYNAFSHVQRRVTAWQNPWKHYENEGYQIVQGLMAIASGGLFGTGIGRGSPASIPNFTSDSIFAVICEQFGMIFGICVLLVYLAIIWRGVNTAVHARRGFHALLAMGSSAMLGIQTLIIIGGVLKLIPLTGVTLPFVSAGGTSLISCLCLMGFIQGAASLNEDDLDEAAELRLLER